MLVQAQVLRDEALLARIDFDLHLATLQRAVRSAVEARLAAAESAGGGGAGAGGGGVPVETLQAKLARLQLESLGASELFNGFAMVRGAALAWGGLQQCHVGRLNARPDAQRVSMTKRAMLPCMQCMQYAQQCPASALLPACNHLVTNRFSDPIASAPANRTSA